MKHEIAEELCTVTVQ